MKLWLKIFLGICIPAVIAVLVVSILLIGQSHNRNIEWETQRCVQEFNVIETNLSNIIKEKSDKKRLIMAYSEYYKNKGIDFIYYENNEQLYSSNEKIKIDDTKLIGVKEDEYYTNIQQLDDKYFIAISTQLGENNVLIYSRDVSSIYNIRMNLIKICIVIVIILIFIIAIIAYIISKTLTKPLNSMQKEMIKVSKGNYDVNLKVGKNEFGILAQSFNEMSKELEKRNNELIELVNSKQLFIDDLSHEINTPLTSILGYAELMEKVKCNPEQQAKFLTYIQEEAKRIRDMHKKLLLLSYKKNGDLEKNMVSTIEIMEKIQQTLRFELENKNINLITNNKLFNIYGDETLIIMCISNLISNAIKVSEYEGQIQVKLYENEKFDCVDVIDYGKGILKEDIQKIIEPFYRVDKSRSRKEGGAGLGLSICKNIMEMHGGKLKIRSELGKGSTFTIEFPKKY